MSAPDARQIAGERLMIGAGLPRIQRAPAVRRGARATGDADGWLRVVVPDLDAYRTALPLPAERA
jgi:hypothetical protein